MPQKICPRCKKGFRYEIPIHAVGWAVVGPTHCPDCEGYRDEELEKATKLTQSSFIPKEITCPDCGGQIYLGINKMRCDTCNPNGKILEEFEHFSKNHLNEILKPKPFQDDKKLYNPEIIKNLPDDYDKESKCFLTTACVEFQGLPDNCLELETLRGYRDNLLIKTSEGQRDIKEYYNVAPRIVRAIKLNSSEKDIWRFVFSQVQNAVKFVQRADYEEAHSCYKSLVNNLKKGF